MYWHQHLLCPDCPILDIESDIAAAEKALADFDKWWHDVGGVEAGT
jgi:hypothetical protein